MNGINLCTVCGCDMGDCNPRQLCCKTYCPMQWELDEKTQSTVTLVDMDVNIPADTSTNSKIIYIDLTGEPDQPTPTTINTIDDLLNSEIFTKMKESKSFKSLFYREFFKDHQDRISFYIGSHFGDQHNKFIIELDGSTIIRYVNGNWVFYIYPYVNPNHLLFIWNNIIVNMLTSECNNTWVKEGEIMYVHVV